MIIAVHCFSILLHCIGRIIQHSSDLYLWLAPLPVCDKRQFFGICVVSRSLFTFGVYCSSFTTVFMAIERTIATNLSRKYENRKSKYGVFLVGSQILLSLLIFFFLFFGGDLPDRPVYCMFYSRKNFSTIVEIVTITSNIFSFAQCYRLYNINMTLRTTNAVTNLSQKYQIEENKTLIPILLSFTSLDFVFMVIYFMSLLIMDMLRIVKTDSTYFGLFELIQCVPVYAIVVIFVMSRVIKRIHHEKTVKLNAEVQIKDEAYFTYLKQQWSHSK
ncbi:hypothetical protein GCK72_019483 [Caenorhabditis remanei]|uniref:G-protein coupled receptors family 1 profile domain-containing protein n=1 Tax=Caenorhabditis remanei TaxID=31234 RepID=A0A6A5GCQ7_CAERE|nr:hypothetical protein GCK72_019483 [Caenorhabditis remanei]KAF1752928.1 hypothetical protein GCK72_019483 [Caenorhabditis remanei]